MPPRIVLRRIHLIATLGAGLWLALSGLTGSLLVFGDRLDTLAHPDLYRVERPGSRAPLEIAIRNARERSGGEVVRMRLAGSETPVHEAWIDCDRCLRVWIDPSTAAVNGVRSFDATTRLWLHELHRRMLLAEAGERAVGAGGIALAVIVLSGLYLWVPGSWSRAFRLQLSKGWKVATHDLHRMGGLIVAPLLLISAISGIYFVFHGPIDRALQRWVDPGVAKQIPLPTIAPADSLGQISDRAASLFPAAETTWITPPAATDGAVVVRLRQDFEAHPNGRTFVWIDPASGAVTRLIDPRHASPMSRLINELYPLHLGRSGGFVHRLLLVVLGLTPTLFFVSGILLWWNRSLRRSWLRAAAQRRSERTITA